MNSPTNEPIIRRRKFGNMYESSLPIDGMSVNVPIRVVEADVESFGTKWVAKINGLEQHLDNTEVRRSATTTPRSRVDGLARLRC